jgi:aminopeptidase-like protein
MGGEGSGSRAPDQPAVHNGADDNASGTAGVLELAQKLSSNRSQLKRSVVFVAFTGEEMGLLGSKEFVNKPPVDLRKVNAMINMDMIGRLNPESNTISIGGTGTSAESDSLLKLLETGRPYKVSHSTDGYGPSDHASFYSENIPVFYFTTGAHDDYHTPADDADKINYTGEVSVLNMVYDLAKVVANGNRLTFREAGAKQATRYGRNMKVTLGIVPDMVSNDNNGLRVDGVRKGGPADRAGIIKGDRVVSIEGQPVTNIYDYMARLGKLKPGQVASVEIIRNDKKQILIVQF